MDVGFQNAVKRPRKVAPKQKYKDYLESKFSSIHKTPKWAIDKKPSAVDSDDEDELFQTAGDYVTGAKSLPKNQLAVKSCMHLNFDKKAHGVINCVQFHRTSALALVSTSNGAVDLFQVDGDNNAKIHSLKFEDFDIDRVRFAVNEDHLIVGSKVKSGYFYSYDMTSGKTLTHSFAKGKEKLRLERFSLSPDGQYIACNGPRGTVHVLDAETKELLFNLQMSDDVVTTAFSSDSEHLFAHGNGGRVFVWSLSTRKCVNKFVDDGCITGTAVAVSPDGRLVATGSDVGVVNVYNAGDVLKTGHPKPVKALMNLTTEVTSLKFNATSELLAMSSSYKDNAIRCVHVPSLSVFSNFPHAGQMFSRVTELDVSPGSGYLAFGNNKGVANLQRLCYFKDY